MNINISIIVTITIIIIIIIIQHQPVQRGVEEVVRRRHPAGAHLHGRTLEAHMLYHVVLCYIIV